MTRAEASNRGLESRLAQYGDPEFAAYLRRSFVHSMGFSRDHHRKPVVGIVNTYSELNHCHLGLNTLAAAVKRGVWAAGGLPVEFPVISLGEQFMSPNAMMYRNLMSLDVEAMIKAQPIDGVVLLGGCDKTLPALLMGAASADLPCIVVAAGPMLASDFRGERIGACTDCRRFWAAYRRGEISREEIDQVEQRLAPTHGTCGVMGTASTMACLCEALGVMLPGAAAIPAVYSDRIRTAEESGRVILEAIGEGRRPSQIMTEAAFENALRLLLAIGGSTNAVIHLTAIAGRLGIRLNLDRLDALSREVPVLVSVKPNGAYYMEDFYRAGGVPVVLKQLQSQLALDVQTIQGIQLRHQIAEIGFPDWQQVIHRFDEPFQSKGSLVVLKGNLAPRGALIKRSCASEELLHVRGKAVVFDSLEDLSRRIDDPELDVRENDILVLKNAGPLGGPGMPEAGYLPIPKKLKGVRDMVRLSDARMSGTAYGTVVLHVSPEAAVGGPLRYVEQGDLIELDVENRRLQWEVSDQELERRVRRFHQPSAPIPERGYDRLFFQHVQQADLGVDFNFLRHPAMNPDDPDEAKG